MDINERTLVARIILFGTRELTSARDGGSGGLSGGDTTPAESSVLDRVRAVMGLYFSALAAWVAGSLSWLIFCGSPAAYVAAYLFCVVLSRASSPLIIQSSDQTAIGASDRPPSHPKARFASGLRVCIDAYVRLARHVLGCIMRHDMIHSSWRTNSSINIVQSFFFPDRPPVS